MPPQYVKLDIGLIDEGGLIEKANEALVELQEHLSDHRREYGEASKGASVKLTIEIEVGIELPKTGDCFIKTKIKKALPSAPPTVSRGSFDLSDVNSDSLFVRSTGSNADAPQQQQIEFTEPPKD